MHRNEEVLWAEAMKVRVGGRFARIWPLLAIGLGVAATVAWIAFLGWLVLKAARLIL
jgi:hypothetical protein